MLLDRIDIDVHGPLNCVELGPFSEHLNVVCGPEGSGKTAIVRFVRDSLVDRDYPLGMMSSSTGRIVWADRNGIVHCRREKDGTAAGRRTIEIESRGHAGPYAQPSFSSTLGAGIDTAWVDQYTSGHHQAAAAKSIQLPESIVDGVITDTSVTSVGRIVSACVRSGLDSPETYRDLPLSSADHGYADAHVAGGHTDHTSNRHGQYEHHRDLRSELADVESEIARLSGTGHSDSATHFVRDGASPLNDSYVRTELSRLHNQSHHLRFRRSELIRWIESMDRQIADYSHGTRATLPNNQIAGGFAIDQQLRRQLDDLDAQMIRWRRTLLEVRGLRESISASYEAVRSSQCASPNYQDLHQARYNGFLDAADHYQVRHPWDASAWYRYSDRPYQQIDDIGARFDSALRHIDELLQRYSANDLPASAWYQSLPNHADAGNLNDGQSYTTRGGTICDSLRAIREDLRIMSHALPSQSHSSERQSSPWYQVIHQRHEDLVDNERWLEASIQGIGRHRDELLRRHASTQNIELANWKYQSNEELGSLRRERDSRVAELRSVSAQLDQTLRQAFELRRSMRYLPILDEGVTYRGYGRSMRIDPITAESPSNSRIEWLQRRRDEIRNQLQTVRRPVASVSPLADLASTWLVRLSGGRLTRVAWPYKTFRGGDLTATYHNSPQSFTGVTIESRDGRGQSARDETHCSGADRALAAIAVRMAAGELLHRTGRPVPLVLETHRELINQTRSTARDAYAGLHNHQDAYHEQGDLGRINDPIAAALRDYAQGGRQIVLLTSDQSLADQLGRVGARQYDLFTSRTEHAHRPVWRPQYSPETYVGPHAHTYGNRGIDGMDRVDSIRGTDAINRDFDVAWREAYGLFNHQNRSEVPASGPVQPIRRSTPINYGEGVASAATDWARDGMEYRDGYYYADTYTTRPADENAVHADHHYNGHHHGQLSAQPTRSSSSRSSVAANAVSPFFLTVDSPIDQAPSIDAVAAARLRGLSITHVTHLMQQDSNRLADSLGLADVDASAIRRWQSECRLACRVPHLRGFDARVLVNCGIRTPAELATIHPVELLQRVEAFLATDRGQQLLLSGSSHELSRLTTWIAAANTNHSEYTFDSDRYEYDADGHRLDANGRRERRRVVASDEAPAFNRTRSQSGRDRQYVDRNGKRVAAKRYGIRSVDQDVDGYDNDQIIDGDVINEDGDRTRRRRSVRNGAANSSGRRNGNGNGYGNGSGRSFGNGSGRGSGNGQSHRSGRSSTRSNRPARDVVNYSDREPRKYTDRDDRQYSRSERQPRERRQYERSERELRSERPERQQRSERAERADSERELRFYLQRDSPVVDAPSIGSRMAARLEAIGIYSVDDLLNANAETVAAELDHRRVDADTVLQWQQQAILVCRVPMLRGHDAQLLVAAEITTAEELVVQDAETLFGLIDPIARGSEGKRIIRGGKLPDREEITEWIEYSQHQRALQAA